MLRATVPPRTAVRGAILLLALVLCATPRLARAAPNHLTGQSSPYLLEHVDNPVDWYPWGDEAIARARSEDRPIFLSIGYSACHWCHVMARESFSDEGIARILNERFVAIKVDREERPDLDAIYMNAVVAMTGGGGWPMSVFLTPDLKPFYGGTYFPKDRFRDLLLAVSDSWKSQRDKALAAAESVSQAVERSQSGTGAAEGAPAAVVPAAKPVSPEVALDGALAALRTSFDKENGGFGTRPKFPPHGDLLLLLRAHRERGDVQALDMAVRTLDSMARGGIYDQIGGGFHRYATDAGWQVPHFEKMLYDNALLVPVYLEAWKESGREDFRRVALETLAWVEREMTDARGGFYGTLDADSEGEEGRFYSWTVAEVRRALPPADAALAIDYFGMTEQGNLGGGRNIPHVATPPAEFAAAHHLTPRVLRQRVEAIRARLLAARALRPRPRCDDKVLTSWNGLMISAFARACAATGEPRYGETARRAARFLLAQMQEPDGRLLAVWRQGRAKLPGTLDDSAFFARGLLDLYDATGERDWLGAARAVVGGADRFADDAGGSYFFTEAGMTDLIVRPRTLEDSALPSGNAIMAEVLARLSQRLNDPSYQRRAEAALAPAASALTRAPAAFAYTILAAGLKRPPVRPAAGLVAIAEAADRPEPAAAGDRLLKGTVVGRPGPMKVVDASLTVPGKPLRPGQAITLSLRLVVQEGWHIQSATPTLSYLIPTRLVFPEAGSVIVDQVAYPEPTLVTLEFAREKLSVYEGSGTIRATVRPPREAPPGDRLVRARLTYQACSDKNCLAPETQEFQIPLRIEGEPVAMMPVAAAVGAPDTGGPSPGVAPAAAAPGGFLAIQMQQHGLLVVLGWIFLMGLSLNLTPCVYPMIPVTIGFFANQSNDGGWGRRVSLPALYVLGMALTYSALGVIAGMTGGLFGATLQNRFVVGALVALFVVMALWMFGVFELRLPSALTRHTGGRRGAFGALLMGLTMGIVAAPCIGPFVVALLAFVGASGNPVLGFWLFFVLAIGMGLPNLVLGIFSGALAGLPRSGVWLIYAKKVMGVALLGVALYFTQPFLSDRHLGVIALVSSVVAGIYLGLLERTRLRSGWFRPLKVAIGVVVVMLGAWLALPLLNARPATGWEPYSPEAVERATAASRPVVIDFFADWCVPCKELDRFTFSDPGVIQATGRFVLLKADLTSFESPAVQGLRERYEVVGVPTIVLLDGRGSEMKDLRLYGFEPPEAFVARLRRVP
ncbi:MAG TPA: DUF255 domain-containing protein [Candidatus Polarisedimenticolia bacterium]|nr:DUF255 domain-containing protein [Candidatus Polarisedimenticolia bacterium]